MRTSILAALAVLSLTTGCGAQNNNGNVKDPLGSASVAKSMALTSEEWSCPQEGTYNVKAPSGSIYQDSMFRVCRSKIEAGKLHISGIASSDVVCVYPMNYVPGAVRADLLAAKKCYDVSDGEAIAQFTVSRSLNYVFMVDSQYTAQMELCMTTSAACPPYVAGSI